MAHKLEKEIVNKPQQACYLIYYKIIYFGTQWLDKYYLQIALMQSMITKDEIIYTLKKSCFVILTYYLPWLSNIRSKIAWSFYRGEKQLP